MLIPAKTNPDLGVLIGRTGSCEYWLKGAWVLRRCGHRVERYDTLPDFAAELEVGALGPGWRETKDGQTALNRFIH